jgi:hypothetical protein
MTTTFTNLFSLSALFIVLSASSSWAQKPDHLSMNMHFKDSTVFIEAKYESAYNVNRDSIYFLLNPGFEIDTIKAKDLMSYRITQKKGMPLPFYRLEFNEPRDTSEMLVVEFKYKINLSEQNHMKSDWIELNADKLWFPNLGEINNEFTYEVTITNFPESYRLVTHTDAKVTQEKNTLTIKKDNPWYEVLVLAGKDLKEWEYDQNIILIGSQEIADSSFQSIGNKVKNSIDMLNGYFGMSDPITSFKVVLRNTSRAELGFQFNRRDMIITGTDFNDYGNLSHEIAHYWWSKANFINEPWMNESFANYSMYQVLKKFDSEDYQRLLARNRELSKNAIPVASASLFTADSYNSYYHKGAIHLIDLEEKIGAELMRQLLSSCVEKSINTTENFLQELEKQTNKENRDFFEGLLKI